MQTVKKKVRKLKINTISRGLRVLSNISCPFCGGKDFTLSIDQGIYKCFNCGKAGSFDIAELIKLQVEINEMKFKMANIESNNEQKIKDCGCGT